jgi:hypothetical protein
MQLQLQNPKLNTLPFEHGGSSPRPHPRRDSTDWSSGWYSGTSAMGWIHVVGKFVVVHQFACDTVHFT